MLDSLIQVLRENHWFNVLYPVLTMDPGYRVISNVDQPVYFPHDVASSSFSSVRAKSCDRSLHLEENNIN